MEQYTNRLQSLIDTLNSEIESLKPDIISGKRKELMLKAPKDEILALQQEINFFEERTEEFNSCIDVQKSKLTEIGNELVSTWEGWIRELVNSLHEREHNYGFPNTISRTVDRLKKEFDKYLNL